MAAPTYVSASPGTADAAGAWSHTISGTVPAAGRFYIVQILQDGATNGAISAVVGTNIENLAGTDDVWTQIPGTNADGSHPVGASGAARQFLYAGRALSSTNPTISGANSTSEDLFIKAVRFDDVSTGTTLGTVIENATAGATANGVATSATAADTGVTTLGVDRLALNFVAVNNDNPIAEFSGQSGGTWVERYEYPDSAGTDGCLQLQTAAMASAGTIDGGTASITNSDSWGVVGFALIGTTVEAADRVPRFSPYPQLLAH